MLLEPGVSFSKVRFFKAAFHEGHGSEISWVASLTGERLAHETRLCDDNLDVTQPWIDFMNKVKDERRKTSLSDDMMKEISIMDRKGLGEVTMLAENVMKNRTTVCMNAVNAFMDKKENMSREKVSDYRAVELLKKWQEVYPQSDETTKMAFESYQKILEKVRASEARKDPPASSEEAKH